MEVIDSLFDAKLNIDTAITVGKFDGLHVGHHLLTSLIKEQGPELKACVVTFGNSPRISLNDIENEVLITNEEREVLLNDLGIDYLVCAPFDEKMMTTSPEDFIKTLCNNLNMKYIACGDDFRFGYKGKGDVLLLESLSKVFNYKTTVVEKIKEDKRDISSTYIREELKQGNINHVNKLLGYNFFVFGRIVHGAHLGTKIGIPTINIVPPDNKMLPGFGVYVSNVEIGSKLYHGVTNVGVKPTVTDNNKIVVETHILDFDKDVYGEKAKVTFCKFLRSEIKFNNVDELKNQMYLDKESAKNYFNL